MNDDDRLKDKLGKLAEPLGQSPAPQREIFPGVDATPLAAILREIDETILAREITFQTPGGKELVLAAANRHLMQLLRLGGAGAPAIAGLDEQTLVEGDDALLANLHRALTYLGEDATGVSVSAQPLARTISPGEVGLSAEMLAARWQIALYGAQVPADPGLAKRFLGACAEFTIASLLFDSNDARQEAGPTEARSGLAAHADMDTEATPPRIAACFAAGQAPHYLVALGESEGDTRVVRVFAGATRAYLLLKKEDVTRARRVWRDLFS